MACILTLPPYQRRGYGKLLIEFSEYSGCWPGAGVVAGWPRPQGAAHTDGRGCCVPSRVLAAQSPGELARNKGGTLPGFSQFWGDCPACLH